MTNEELIARIQGALNTEETGAALIEVAKAAHTAELQNAKWNEVFQRRCSREVEMIEEAEIRFVSLVLDLLAEKGIDTRNCDGDDNNAHCLADWIVAKLTDDKDRRQAFTRHVARWACEKDALRAALKSVHYWLNESGQDDAFPNLAEEIKSALDNTENESSNAKELADLMRP